MKDLDGQDSRVRQALTGLETACGCFLLSVSVLPERCAVLNVTEGLGRCYHPLLHPSLLALYALRPSPGISRLLLGRYLSALRCSTANEPIFLRIQP